MNGHHLILGQLEDFITGNVATDTHDERYRQKIARFLVEEKGYLKKEIDARQELLVKADHKKAIIKIDFVVRLTTGAGMLIKYGPGSIVTRHRPAMGASRLLESYQIPIVVVTNGEDADILEGETGCVVASGFDGIPSRTELLSLISEKGFHTVSPERAEKESRIVFAFDVDGSCPCDDDICVL